MTKYIKEGIQYDFGLFTFVKRKDNIMQVNFERKISYGLKQAYLSMKFKLSVEPTHKMRTLLTFKESVDISDDAHHYLMSEEYHQFLECVAVIPHNKEQLETINKFSILSATPHRAFATIEEATEWLSTFEPTPLSKGKIDSYVRELDTRIEALDYVVR